MVGDVRFETDAFQGVLALLVRHWLLLIVSALVGIIVGVAGYWVTPRSYSAEVILLPTENDSPRSLLQGTAGRLGALTGLAGLGLEAGGFRSEGVALLSSKEFVGDFIESKDLIPQLFYKQFDSAGSRWTVPEDEVPTRNDGINLFQTSVMSVSEDVDLGTIAVKVAWVDPELASEWANAVALMLNTRIRERVMREAQEGRIYLEKELNQAMSVELRATIAGLIEQRLNSEAMAKARPDFAFRIVAKAIPADADDFDSPSLGLYLVGGGMLGALLGLFLGIAREWWPSVSKMRAKVA